jgi:hypothetical protein
MCNLLTPPPNAVVTDNPTLYYWFDDDGILCSVSKKVCMLMDVTYLPSSNKQTREYAAKEFPKLVKALALVCKSPMSRVLAHLFFAVVTTPLPTKMFTTEADAKQWLMQYINNSI